MNKVVHHNKWNWGEQFLIVLESGEGIVSVSLENDSPGEAIIHGLSVIEPERRKGLGTKLIAEAESLISGFKKVDLITVYVEPGNDWLLGWYERLGYVAIEGEDEGGYIQAIKTLAA